MENHLSKVLLLTLLGLTLYFTTGFGQAYATNRLALLTTRILLNQAVPMQPYDTISFREDATVNCRMMWLGGLIADHNRWMEQRNQLWHRSLQCEPMVVTFLAIIDPDEPTLAGYAVEVQPDYSESWFWLAGTYLDWRGGRPVPQDEAQRAEIIDLYQTGLALAPHDGLRWRQLGDLLHPVDPEAAIEAYLQSCFNGDPGSNGCLRAGRTAEQLGDIESAIRYYRYSRWEGALNRAVELETQQQEE
jgi:hypothetical protein